MPAYTNSNEHSFFNDACQRLHKIIQHLESNEAKQAEHGNSAYDCEYVSLAVNPGTELFTSDKKVIAEFPLIAKPLRDVEL